MTNDCSDKLTITSSSAHAQATALLRSILVEPDWTGPIGKHSALELLGLAQYGVNEQFKSWVVACMGIEQQVATGRIQAIDGWVSRAAARLEKSFGFNAGDGLAMMRYSMRTMLYRLEQQSKWMESDDARIHWECDWWPVNGTVERKIELPESISTSVDRRCDISKLLNECYVEKVTNKKRSEIGGYVVEGCDGRCSCSMGWAPYWAYEHDFGVNSSLELLTLATSAFVEQWGAWLYVSEPDEITGGMCAGRSDYLEMQVWDQVFMKIQAALAERLVVSGEDAEAVMAAWLEDDVAFTQAEVSLLVTGRYDTLQSCWGWFEGKEDVIAELCRAGHRPPREYPGRYLLLPPPPECTGIGDGNGGTDPDLSDPDAFVAASEKKAAADVEDDFSVELKRLVGRRFSN